MDQQESAVFTLCDAIISLFTWAITPSDFTKSTVIAVIASVMKGVVIFGAVFGLQLSFIDWTLLSAFTFDLLANFFVEPYQCYTYAALYRRLDIEKNVENI